MTDSRHTQNGSRRNSHRRIAQGGVALALSAALVVGLSGCDTFVPQPETDSTSSEQATPSVTEAQEKKIESNILSVIEAADKAEDTKKLSERVEGPALQVRTSQLKIVKETGTKDAKMTIPKDIRQTVLPVTTGWPRFIYTITSTTEDQQSERLLVLNQSSARSNYKLWGLVRLFSGVSLPKFPIPSIGAKTGTLKDTGLVATPEKALTMYADLLQKADKSEYADTFTSDQLRTELADLTDSVQKGVEANKGSQSQTFTANTDTAKVMRTADGGDLVVAQIDSVWDRSAGEGRESQPASDAEKALYGKDDYTSKMRVTYVNVVALYIPPASSTAKIEAVGAERQPVKVEAVK
ncbi:MAG: hypothetical protein LKJ44_06815 [Bifidobacteriaceae bacterium]|jgi:hypothetical protein|nr:hypothetical protein [Bifidobacteriaceae bacterium]MCI1979399.1 hypothetical protein [Bifidobacteriaceae bacterium]